MCVLIRGPTGLFGRHLSDEVRADVSERADNKHLYMSAYSCRYSAPDRTGLSLTHTIAAACSCSKALRATFITDYIGITVVQGMFLYLRSIL